MFKLSKADRVYIENHRGCYSPESRWYVALVHWGRERRVLQHVGGKPGSEGITELFLPELAPDPTASGDLSRPRLLFGGYLFFRCRMTDEIYLALNEEPYITKIYGRAFRIPEPIDDEEMRLFRTVLRTDPQPSFVTGRHCGRIARVTSGMLAGQTGRVIEVSMRAIKLEVNYSFLDLGHSIIVSVPRELVRLDPDPLTDDVAMSTLFESEGRN